jgi:hypothetical protein
MGLTISIRGAHVITLREPHPGELDGGELLGDRRVSGEGRGEPPLRGVSHPCMVL